MDLTGLTYPSRIKWVFPIFARLLTMLGYGTAQKATKSNYTVLYNKLKMLNDENKFYRCQLGLNDVNR